MIHSVQTWIMYACVALLAAVALCAAFCLAGGALAAVRRVLSGWRLCAFAVLASVAAIYGGRKGTVTYPRTDPQQAYLVDAGSYVTNDLVHINFTRLIVPNSAALYVDRRPVDSTNDVDWVNQLVTTFGETLPPFDVPFATATNYDWIVYTTWTPGPSVVTNGVWHANWGKDVRNRVRIIPLRTAVRVDGRTIATPKSKEDNE